MSEQDKKNFMAYFEDEESKELEKKAETKTATKKVTETKKPKPKLKVVKQPKLPSEMEVIAEVLQRLIKKVEDIADNKKIEHLIEEKMNIDVPNTDIITEAVTSQMTEVFSPMFVNQNKKIATLQDQVKTLLETIQDIEVPTPEIKLNIPEGTHTVKKTIIRNEDKDDPNYGMIEHIIEEIEEPKKSPIKEAFEPKAKVKAKPRTRKTVK